MLKLARFDAICAEVNQRKFVSLKELMDLTHSSESTIRADLVELDALGRLTRVRGGATAINDETISYELSVEDKMGLFADSKRAIAEYASSLVPDHGFVYIDAGTSTYYLADAIHSNGTKFVTNSLTIAKKLKTKGYTVYAIGGEFKLTTDAFIGAMAAESISHFIFDAGFFGANGIDLKLGFTTPDYEEAIVKKTAMGQCQRCYVLVDHSKFGVKTAVSFRPFNPHEIITDKINDKAYQNLGIKEVKTE